MDNSREIIPRVSDLSHFLSGEIGKGATDERISVSLALSRLGIDPYVEGGFLATMPRASAAEKLARLILATPGSLWDLTDARAISERLVLLLPVHCAIGGA